MNKPKISHIEDILFYSLVTFRDENLEERTVNPHYSATCSIKDLCFDFQYYIHHLYYKKHYLVNGSHDISFGIYATLAGTSYHVLYSTNIPKKVLTELLHSNDNIIRYECDAFLVTSPQQQFPIQVEFIKQGKYGMLVSKVTASITETDKICVFNYLTKKLAQARGIYC